MASSHRAAKPGRRFVFRDRPAPGPRIQQRLRRSRRRSAFGILVISAALTIAFSSVSDGSGALSPSGALHSIYGLNARPTTITEYDSRSVELGVQFTVGSPGYVVGLRFYKGVWNTGTHTGTVWDAHGKALVTAKFEAEGTSGWQRLTFAQPLAVTPGVTYTASYHASQGHYSQQVATFYHGATLGTSLIRATRGVYSYGASAFPTNSWRDSSYYVDVLFQLKSSLAVAPTVTPTPAPSNTPAPTQAAPTTPRPTATAAAKPTPTPRVVGVPVSRATPAPTPTPVTTLTGFPTSATTGPTGTLTVKTGNITVAAGATLSNVDVAGQVVLGPNAKLINSRVRCENQSDWCLTLDENDTVTDTEVGGGATGTAYTDAIGVYTGGPNNVLTRVDIHNTSDAVRLDGGTTIQDSYIHDLVINQFPGVHSDGAQMTQAHYPTYLYHNSITGGTFCALYIEHAGTQSVTADGNLLLADHTGSNKSGYGFNVSNESGHITLTNNVFDPDWNVAPYRVPAGSTVSGNVTTAGTPI